MPETGLTPDPDDKPIYAALRAAGAPEELAYTAVQRIRDVAAANMIAQLMAKLDTQNAKLDAQNGIIAAQNATSDSLRWVLGAGLAALGLRVAALRLFA